MHWLPIKRHQVYACNATNGKVERWRLGHIFYRNIFFLVDEVDVGVAAVVFDLDDVGQVDVVVDTENGKNGSKPA